MNRLDVDLDNMNAQDLTNVNYLVIQHVNDCSRYASNQIIQSIIHNANITHITYRLTGCPKNLDVLFEILYSKQSLKSFKLVTHSDDRNCCLRHNDILSLTLSLYLVHSHIIELDMIQGLEDRLLAKIIELNSKIQHIKFDVDDWDIMLTSLAKNSTLRQLTFWIDVESFVDHYDRFAQLVKDKKYSRLNIKLGNYSFYTPDVYCMALERCMLRLLSELSLQSLIIDYNYNLDKLLPVLNKNVSLLEFTTISQFNQGITNILERNRQGWSPNNHHLYDVEFKSWIDNIFIFLNNLPNELSFLILNLV